MRSGGDGRIAPSLEHTFIGLCRLPLTGRFAAARGLAVRGLFDVFGLRILLLFSMLSQMFVIVMNIL